VEGVTALVGGGGNSASRMEEGARSPVVRIGWEGGGAVGLRLELGSRGLSVGSRRRRSQLKRGRVWGRWMRIGRVEGRRRWQGTVFEMERARVERVSGLCGGEMAVECT